MKFKVIVGVVIAAFLVAVVYVNAKTTNHSETAKPAVDFSALVGQPAPDFNLTSYNGQSISLNSFRGKAVVLFFSEGLMCYPACWNQIAALGSDQSLNNDRVTTASIVTDMPDEWAAAIKKMPAMGQEMLLFDSDKTVSAAYGTLSLESSMHKGVKPGHTYVLIDANGIVRYAYDDPNMGVENDKLIEQVNKL